MSDEQEGSVTLKVLETGETNKESEARMNPSWPPEMLKVSYVGPFLYPTGYGEACRSHARALRRAGVGVMARLNQMPHPNLQYELVRDDHEVNEMLDQRFWPSDKATREPDAWLWHLTPDEYRRAQGKTNVGYAAWETMGLPQGWAEACNTMDGLFVPSPFCAGLFRNGGVTVPISVCPHPIDLKRFNPEVDGSALRATFGNIKTLFLVVSQLMFRKGVEDIINAFATEFVPDEGAGLVLLAWRWSHTVSERNAVMGGIKFLVKGLNLRREHPPIWFIGDNLVPAAIPVLYAASDAYVSASRGEAFGLPAFEAGACGKPTIATGWGGVWDVFSEESGYPIDYDIETVHGAGPRWRHYDSTQKWAKPRFDALRAAMRRAHERPDERLQKGRMAAAVVAERLAVPVTGDIMVREIRKMVDKKG